MVSDEIIRRKQTVFELIVVTILIISIIIPSVLLFGGKLQDSVTKSTCKLTNNIYVNGMRAGEGYCLRK